MTEEEARTKWCPFAFTFGRLAHGDDYANNSFGPQNRGATMKQPLETCMCIASACMAWQTEAHYEVTPGTTGQHQSKLVITGGYCGLAGKP